MIDSLYTTIREFLNSNQFASGTLLVGITGAALAYARNVPTKLWNRTKECFSATVEIRYQDELFEHIETWLAVRRPMFSRAFKASYSGSRRNRRPSHINLSNEDCGRTLCVTAGVGTHWLKHNKMLVRCVRVRDEQKVASDPYTESFFVTVFGWRKLDKKITTLLTDIIKQTTTDENIINVYHRSTYNDWCKVGTLKTSAQTRVVLQANNFVTLIDDITSFFRSQQRYEQLGIGWKRGYLFDGPPGNGKTSTIVALAQHFERPIYLVSDVAGITQRTLVTLFGELPPKAFVVFEDIDTMFMSRSVKHDDDDDENKNDARVSSLGALLNALDGIFSPEGRIVFMTTNYINRLDPALIRPGRIDRIVHFHNANEEQAKTLFTFFFPAATENQLQIFAERIVAASMSVASTKEILIRATTADEVIALSDTTKEIESTRSV